MSSPKFTIRTGDALEELRKVRDGSVHCVVTSPPYWGLRDYGTGDWIGGDLECNHRSGIPRQDHSHGARKASRGTQGSSAASAPPQLQTCGKCGATRRDQQLGLEPTPTEYVARLVEVFEEVRRVLRDDGVCWLNLGDSYVTRNNGPQGQDSGHAQDRYRCAHGLRSAGRPEGLKHKDLVGVPWMVAFALREAGWYLRAEVIWWKSNPMPESILDRPTKAHEQLFLLTKSASYFYDAHAIAEPAVTGDTRRPYAPGTVDKRGNGHDRGGGTQRDGDTNTRNIRSVWKIPTRPFRGAHFAVFPPTIPERCILAGTSEHGACAQCGAPWVRVLERASVNLSNAAKAGTVVEGKEHPTSQVREGHDVRNGPTSRNMTKGWKPTCDCGAAVEPCVVLDPFSGSGTAGMVALSLDRSFLGLELNAEFVEMARARIEADAPLFNREAWVDGPWLERNDG